MNIDYAMTADYRSNWGSIEAVRELVQNCLDNKDNPSTYEYSEGRITITTHGYVLPMSSFALGESVKQGSSIGGFGEGFKLALMVLQREGLWPYIAFGNKFAKPIFELNELLGRDTFRIDIRDDLEEEDRTTFSFDFPEDKYELLQERINVFSDNVLPLPNTVDLIEHKPGTVMVNGLFVCEEAKFKHGYNFAPDKLALGCDREIASTFGMAWETSEVWADRLDDNNADEVLSMMSEDQMDVESIHHHLDEHKAKLITKAFTARFGHVEIKPMGSTLSYGMSVGGSLYSTMKKSGYTKVANPHEEAGTPYRALIDFLEKEKKHMRRHAKVEFQELLTKAKGWKR
jgi:hypothetical protein